ncbi:M20/M25/M40 family metallo-hydrolase [Gemmatimonas sp.]|jgi:acetylornithine deacetylase/succinyl-diaminopimelate desuccinylase-like protein|uniref:M20/M25/M40 family metallo-hydrolase n=1 Tax=Gemmatimonas sp. TaxID=1962908 RepID=UPI0037BEDA8B
MRRLFTALTLATLAAPAIATAQPLRQQVDAWRKQHEREILDEAFALFAIPNVASNPADIAKNVVFLTQAFAKRGVPLVPLRAASGGSPALFGELKAPGATRTVVFYAHFDGQPVAGGGWDHDPFTPKLNRYRNSAPTDDVPLPAPGDTVDPEVRIRARSASDDKGPIVAMLSALDAMKALGKQRSVNVKFFLEGEEEAGSNHLAEILRTNKDKLAADAWLFFDGPVHVSGAPQIVLGVRGVMGAEVTFYGANRALHSGHYGNWAPNPAVSAAHFVASLRDRDGRVLIPGFYTDVPAVSDEDTSLARALSTTDDSVRTSLGLSRTEADNAALGERIMQPALNLRGIRAGNVGSGASNAVPTSASVSIDFRLVPDQQPARIRRLLEAHLAQQGYTIVRDPNAATKSADRGRLAYVTYDSGYTAVRVPSATASVQAVKRVMARSYGREPFTLPILGGSLPLFHFVEQLGATVITVPTVNADNSQHAPNENLRIGNLWDGIALMTELMTTLGKEWGPRS